MDRICYRIHLLALLWFFSDSICYIRNRDPERLPVGG